MKRDMSKITESLVGTKVVILSDVDYFSEGDELTIVAVEGRQYCGHMPVLLELSNGESDWADWEHFDLLDEQPIKLVETLKSTKTSRKAMGKSLRFQIDKLNDFIRQAELHGLTVVLDSEAVNTVELVEVSFQPKTPPKEDL